MIILLVQNKNEIEKLREEIHNLDGRLLVYTEIKKKYEREKEEKKDDIIDILGNSIYPQKRNLNEIFDLERKMVIPIFF